MFAFVLWQDIILCVVGFCLDSATVYVACPLVISRVQKVRKLGITARETHGGSVGLLSGVSAWLSVS
jgi:hypothetical protein